MTTISANFRTAQQPMVRWGSLVRVGLVAIPIMLAALLSATALVNNGIDYVSPTGSAPLKVHPATYAACLSFLIFFFSGSAKQILDIVFFNKPALWPFFAGLVGLFAYAAIFLSVPFMFLIDNFLLTGLVVILLLLLSQKEVWAISTIFDGFMALNSLLGIYEALNNWRLVPITAWSATLGQWVYPHEWRATAFLGHPLANGYVTGAYLLSLMISTRIKRLGIRLPLVGLHFIGMLAFGSRSALAYLVAGFLLYLGYEAFRVVRTGRARRDMVAYAFLAIPFVVLFVPLVLVSGFADRFIDRFTNDGGSAEARTIMLDVIANFDLSDLVLGPPAKLTVEILKRYQILAVESFWLNFLLLFGFVGWAIFAPALYRICKVVWSYTNWQSVAVLGYFFLSISTAVGLSSKTTIFAMIVTICLTNEGFHRPAKTVQRRRRPGQAVRPMGSPAMGVGALRVP